jgi:hypothetical protein
MPSPSQFNIPRRPGPRHIAIFNEDTGEEIGRFEGLEWMAVTDDTGLPVTGNITVNWDKGARSTTIRGPLKKIAMVTGYKGALSDVQEQRIKGLQMQLQSEFNTSKERLEELVRCEQRLVAILRMLGGAVTIDDLEIAEAGNYIIEESRDSQPRLYLTLVERA